MDAPPPTPYRSLFMRRGHLQHLPPVALPAGFRLRLAGPADVAGLSGLLSAAFEELWDEECTRRRLIEDATVVAIYVIERADGALAATASSRLLPDRYPGCGYLHWVGVAPADRGRRLGFQITMAVLHDFARRGLTGSVLETDDWRLPAIATYLKCGYLPEPREPEDLERWEAVRAALRVSAQPSTGTPSTGGCGRGNIRGRGDHRKGESGAADG